MNMGMLLFRSQKRTIWNQLRDIIRKTNWYPMRIANRLYRLSLSTDHSVFLLMDWMLWMMLVGSPASATFLHPSMKAVRVIRKNNLLGLVVRAGQEENCRPKGCYEKPDSQWYLQKMVGGRILLPNIEQATYSVWVLSIILDSVIAILAVNWDGAERCQWQRKRGGVREKQGEKRTVRGFLLWFSPV